MRLLNPEFLILVPILIFLCFFVMKNSSGLNAIFAKEILDKLLVKGDIISQNLRKKSLLFAMFLMILALARPISDEKDIVIDSSTNNLIIALDISRSMLSDDIYPNRLEFSKNQIKELFKNSSELNIGILAFAKDAFLLSPITNDKASLEFLLDNLDANFISRQGTDIKNAFHSISLMFKDAKNILLISDGGEDDDIKEAVKIAQQHNFKVSVLLVGTDEGGSIKTENGLLKDHLNNIVITKRNDNLIALSDNTNGVFIKEFGGGGGMLMFKNSFDKEKTQSHTIKSQKEWFKIILVFSLFFVCVAFLRFYKKT